MTRPFVSVVMSTYNGEKFLREQLDSILKQKDVEIRLCIRDDGSSDKTLSILDEYASKSVTILKGDNIGAKFSFLYALQKAPDADYYAFSDQDDVWDDDKLTIAISKIKETEKNNSDKPLLYSGRTRLVDLNLNFMQNGKNHHRRDVKWLCGEPLSAAGCTMVFNKKLKDIVASYIPVNFPMHDAWVTNVCLAVGGKIVYDDIPHISYRQHSSNVVGGKKDLFTSIKRRIHFYKKMGANYHIKMYKEIMTNYESLMSESIINRCKKICNYRCNLKSKIDIIKDKMFWQGSIKWKIETLCLVIFNYY